MALAGVLALVGCRDMGLEYNYPLEEAEQMPPSELVVAVHPSEVPAGHELVVAGQLWVPSGQPRALSEDELEPIGAASGQTVYARSWDQEPYGELFTRLPEPATETDVLGSMGGQGWRAYLPVIGGGGPAAPGADAGEHGEAH